MTITRTVKTERSTGTGREVHEDIDVGFPTDGDGRSVGVVAKLAQTVGFAEFTDGGAAVGTYQMTGSLPAGAMVLKTKILVPAGFAGDTSAVVTIGDGSDADRYMTGTPNVFATAAAGVEAGVPSGALLLTALNRPTITITAGSDWGAVTAGSITVEIYYIDA